MATTNGTSENKYKLQDADYDRFLNSLAKAWKPSFVRSLYDVLAVAPKGTIFLGGGMPNPHMFPFKDAEFNLANGERLFIDENKFREAQQYGPTIGYPPFLEQVKDLVLKYHNPPNYANSKVVITSGGQDGFARALNMMLSPQDYIIVEEPTFCCALSVIRPHKMNVLGVKSDAYGMIPDLLREQLSKWDPDEVRNKQHGVPKVLYITPVANNPSGASLITERKKEIYEIARIYNLVILEDDPYYFIEFGNKEIVPRSFLSMDTDGRVIRCDSFSKIACSGFRIGYTTGPAKLVSKFVENTEATLLQSSSLSQVILSELLKKWTSEGFENHIEKIKKFYLIQSDAMNNAAKKHLTGLCEWHIPTGGLFYWFKVLVLDDAEEMIMKRGLNKKLILMPGNSFMVDEDKPCPYLRMSYSTSSPEELDEACRRLAELIREEVDIVAKRSKYEE